MHGIHWRRSVAQASVICALAAAALATCSEPAHGHGRRVAIVVGRDAAPLERLAAQELQRYLAQLTDAAPAIAGAARGRRRPLILVGRPETNAAIARLVARGLLPRRPPAAQGYNNTAALSYEVSTGAQTANTPKVTRYKLLFDFGTDEHWLFQFKMPGDYVSGGTLRGQIGVGAVSPGNVIMKAGISESTANRTDDVFLAGDVSAAIAMPATANQGTEFTIALTMTSIAANDEVVLFVGRDADNASDTVNANDVELTSLNLEYTN